MEVEFIESSATTTTVLRNLQPFSNYTAEIRPTCSGSYALCTNNPQRFMTDTERKCFESIPLCNISGIELINEV